MQTPSLSGCQPPGRIASRAVHQDSFGRAGRRDGRTAEGGDQLWRQCLLPISLIPEPNRLSLSLPAVRTSETPADRTQFTRRTIHTPGQWFVSSQEYMPLVGLLLRRRASLCAAWREFMTSFYPIKKQLPQSSDTAGRPRMEAVINKGVFVAMVQQPGCDPGLHLPYLYHLSCSGA